jgi:glycosyltransferase involved in cell wall biosynthesis
MMGEYKPSDLKNILTNIDIVVVPSFMEIFGIVILEAFQHKIPVIASNAGGIPEAVKDGINGLLFENNDENDLYEKLKYVVENREIIQQLSENCCIPKSIEDDAKWHYEQYGEMLSVVSCQLSADEGLRISNLEPHTSYLIPHTSKKRILIYYFKNVHIPILKSITEALKRRSDVELALGYMYYAPDIRAGFLPEELEIIKAYGLPMYEVPQDFKPDVTIIADSVYPWVKDCGKLVNVGHGVLSKGQYYTDTEMARREELADVICVPGVYHKERMEKIVSKAVIATGMAKLDGLFGRQELGAWSLEMGDRKPKTENRKHKPFTILFAPTFNDELSAIPFVKDRINEVLPDVDSVLYIKLHGSTAQKYKDMYEQLALVDDRVIYVREHDVTPYLEIADVLISDVSSVMMEFAALDKPVVLFNNPMQKTYKNYNPNDLEYMHRDIGFQVNDIDEMKLAVLKIYRGNDPYKEKRKEVTDRLFANKYDGKATERIVEIVLSV